MTSERIESAILEAVDEVNLTLPDAMQLERAADAVIFGRGGKLDSLGLVNFVLAVEEKLAALGMNVSLTDQRAMSRTRSPFRSVKALSAFVEEIARERRVN
jgi:acyl carrier protein